MKACVTDLSLKAPSAVPSAESFSMQHVSVYTSLMEILRFLHPTLICVVVLMFSSTGSLCWAHKVFVFLFFICHALSVTCTRKYSGTYLLSTYCILSVPCPWSDNMNPCWDRQLKKTHKPVFHNFFSMSLSWSLQCVEIKSFRMWWGGYECMTEYSIKYIGWVDFAWLCSIKKCLVSRL